MVRPIGQASSKEELVSSLQTLRTAAIYNIFAQTALQRFYRRCLAGEAHLDELDTLLPEGRVTLRQFTDGIDALGTGALVETKRNANRAVARNLLKEVFRLTQSYCERTGQSDKLNSASWYQFARVTVNCLSHSFLLEFRPYDLTCLPVSFRNKVIDSELNNQPAPLILEDLVVLTDEIIALARTLI